MIISVSSIANAINNREHIKPNDIIMSISVTLTDNTKIDYTVKDYSGRIEKYTEDTVPVSVVRLMNYNKCSETWKEANKEYIIYNF